MPSAMTAVEGEAAAQTVGPPQARSHLSERLLLTASNWCFRPICDIHPHQFRRRKPAARAVRLWSPESYRCSPHNGDGLIPKRSYAGVTEAGCWLRPFAKTAPPLNRLRPVHSPPIQWRRYVRCGHGAPAVHVRPGQPQHGRLLPCQRLESGNLHWYPSLGHSPCIPTTVQGCHLHKLAANRLRPTRTSVELFSPLTRARSQRRTERNTELQRIDQWPLASRNQA